MDEQTQQNILFEFKRLTVIFLAGLLHFVWSSIAKEECVLLPSDLLTCAQKHGVTHIADIGVGYGFGFGSVQDVEVMCRTKWHLKVYSCAHQTIYSRCVADTSSQFRRTMWQFIFDTSRYSRAATYLCRAHNLRIFQTYKDSCLIPYEQEVQFCSEQYSSLLSATTVRLATNNPSNLTNEDSYAEYMKKELTHAYCLGITEKLNCISSILHKHCSSDITELIRNYFRETLPTDCEPHLLANRDNSSYAQNTRRTTRKLGKSRTDFQNIAPVGEGGRTRSAVAAASKSKGLRPQILQIVSFRTPLKFLISHSSATVILAVVWDVYQFVL